MKSLTLITMLAVAALQPIANARADQPPATFDAELAQRLGADDYGMRRYVMAFLKTGPDRSHDPETTAQIQRGHLDHIKSLADAGQLVLAGPFLDGGELRGIFVFAVDTVEEARALAEADPAVSAGRLTMELHPWYGSASLLMINEIHAKLALTSP